MIALSVQGSLFSLSEAFVESQPWLLSKIATSLVPFETIGDVIYVDADPPSFRLIVSMLKGLIRPDFDRMLTADLLLLKATAEYLLCEPIVDELDRYMQARESLMERKEDEIRKRDIELARIRPLAELVDDVDITYVKCVTCRAGCVVLGHADDMR